MRSKKSLLRKTKIFLFVKTDTLQEGWTSSTFFGGHRFRASRNPRDPQRTSKRDLNNQLREGELRHENAPQWHLQSAGYGGQIRTLSKDDTRNRLSAWNLTASNQASHASPDDKGVNVSLASGTTISIKTVYAHLRIQTCQRPTRQPNPAPSDDSHMSK